MTTSTLSNTTGTTLLAHTQLASAAIAVGSAVDVSGKLAALISVRAGRTVATALTNELRFALQVSMDAGTDNDDWVTRYEFTTGSGKTACNAPTLNGATSAGATTFAVSSATGIAKGDKLYLRETGTPGDSEWCEVKDISGTTVTPLAALTRAHTNGITITDLAEMPAPWTESLAGVKYVRFIADGGTNTSGQTVDVLAVMNTLDNITAA